MPYDQNKMSTAYHEAGHAIAQRYFGIKIKYVFILKDGDSLGVMKGRLATQLKQLENRDFLFMDKIKFNVERDVIVFLAGSAAQREFMPRSVKSHHGRHDIKQAFTLLERITGSSKEMNAYFELLSIQAAQFVRLPLIKLQIEALAKELIVRKKMTGNEVQSVIEALFPEMEALKKSSSKPQ